MKHKALIAAALAGWVASPAWGADHVETPKITADPPADIADVYLWRPDQSANRIALGMTFGGRSAATANGVRIDGPTMFCDRNILYVFNIDNNADGNLDATADIQIFARLARNGNGQCGFRIENVPGAGGRAITGREGLVSTDAGSGLRGFAGLVEDPFFFDTCGFGALITSINTDPPQDSVPASSQNTCASSSATGTGISNQFDGFAGRNLSGIIFEMDLDAVTGGNAAANPTIQVWGDTYRFPGTAP